MKNSKLTGGQKRRVNTYIEKQEDLDFLFEDLRNGQPEGVSDSDYETLKKAYNDLTKEVSKRAKTFTPEMFEYMTEDKGLDMCMDYETFIEG